MARFPHSESPLLSSLSGLTQPPLSSSEVPPGSLFEPTTLEEWRIRALLVKQSPWAALLTFYFPTPLGALLIPSPNTSASAPKPIFPRCMLLRRGEGGRARIHLVKPSQSSLAVGNQLLPHCQDSTLGTEESPLMTGCSPYPCVCEDLLISCTDCGLLFANSLYPVPWHPVRSGVYDTLLFARYFMAMTLMGIFSFGVLTTPTPYRGILKQRAYF